MAFAETTYKANVVVTIFPAKKSAKRSGHVWFCLLQSGTTLWIVTVNILQIQENDSPFSTNQQVIINVKIYRYSSLEKRDAGTAAIALGRVGRAIP